MTSSFAPPLLALLEGLGLIASPCILPILPLMLAASWTGGRARPFGIIAGFIAAFAALALLARQFFAWAGVEPDLLRDIALALLVLFGLTMLSARLSDALFAASSRLADWGQRQTARFEKQDGSAALHGGFWGGMGVGALIGLVWTPCAGPIMAAAVVQIVQTRTGAEAALTVGMFALGAGVPMLLIALLGRQLMDRLAFLKSRTGLMRRALGIVMIVTALLIYSGADASLIAATAPQPGAPVAATGMVQDGLPEPYDAPEIAGIDAWLNGPPLKLADLRGKVVLIDFWTYSCINCIRTFPFLKAWDERYRDKGLVIIGMHTPEFGFEKKFDNVKQAVARFGLRYPVALDNEFGTWNAFGNRYWPAHYLIDRQGRVVYRHFGEGHYDVTENNIRALLGLDQAVAAPVTAPGAPPIAAGQTPETYLGSARAERQAGDADADAFPATLPLHGWALKSGWKMRAQYCEAQRVGAALRLHFSARKIFLVLGSTDGAPVEVRVTLDGKPAPDGKDVHDGKLTVTEERLYELTEQGAARQGIIEIETLRPGLLIYAFTFES